MKRNREATIGDQVTIWPADGASAELRKLKKCTGVVLQIMTIGGKAWATVKLDQARPGKPAGSTHGIPVDSLIAPLW